MLTKRRLAYAIAALLASTQAQGQTQTYVTGFTKTDNIYTNLNQNYPHSGVGVPGSGTGTSNATFLFDPATYNSTYTPANTNNINYTTNGIRFQITSNSTGQDFAEIGPAAFGVSSLVVPVNLFGVTSVYFLASAYNGTSANFTFTGTGGATQTFSNITLPDFNGGAPINTVGGGVSDQTVYRIQSVGAGGSGNSTTGAFNFYTLTELGFTLGSQFAGQTLQNVDITSNRFETLILGVTAVTPTVTVPPVGAVPEPATWAMMLVGFAAAGTALRRQRTGRPALA